MTSSVHLAECDIIAYRNWAYLEPQETLPGKLCAFFWDMARRVNSTEGALLYSLSREVLHVLDRHDKINKGVWLLMWARDFAQLSSDVIEHFAKHLNALGPSSNIEEILEAFIHRFENRPVTWQVLGQPLFSDAVVRALPRQAMQKALVNLEGPQRAELMTTFGGLLEPMEYIDLAKKVHVIACEAVFHAFVQRYPDKAWDYRCHFFNFPKVTSQVMTQLQKGVCVGHAYIAAGVRGKTPEEIQESYLKERDSKQMTTNLGIAPIDWTRPYPIKDLYSIIVKHLKKEAYFIDVYEEAGRCGHRMYIHLKVKAFYDNGLRIDCVSIHEVAYKIISRLCRCYGLLEFNIVRIGKVAKLSE